MQEEICTSLISLSKVFNEICVKVIDPNIMQMIREEVVETISSIEKVFPLAMFVVMTHLVINLVEELDLCGHVHTRWMYPFERYMKALKGYVRNMAWPGGSMANGYSIEEALGFCIKYIQEVNSTRRRVWEDKEEPTMNDEVLEGNGHPRRRSANLKNWAHTFILHNASTTEPWCE
jgi:hypothetical protein